MGENVFRRSEMRGGRTLNCRSNTAEGKQSFTLRGNEILQI